MMLPNASINFGVRKSTPNLIDADGSRSTTNQSLPFSLPIFPGPVLMKSMAMETPRCTWLAGWDHLGPFARRYFVKRTIQSPKSDQPAPSLTPVVLITPLLTQSFWHEAMLHIRQTPFQGSDTQSEVGSEGRVGMAM